jgi:predicted DNA-binding transcriptional regulator AlpA
MKKIRQALEAIPDRLWTCSETAQFLGIQVSMLYQLNYKGTGPRFYRVGKYRRYKPGEVLSWLNSHAIERMA